MNKSIPTNDIERAVIERAGESPNKPFVWDGKFTTRWGGKKRDNFGFSGDPNRKQGTFFDYREQKSQTFHLEGYTFKEKKYTPPPIQDVSEEFYKLKKCTSHPYLIKKAVKIPKDLDLRLKKGLLIVPIFGKTGQMISWQQILPEKDKEGKDKRFKSGSRIADQTPHLVIGEATNAIYVCEGLATALSVHSITKKQCIASFNKSNLINVASMVKTKNNKVVICRDNDGTNTIKIEDKKFIILTPYSEDTDFNDCQNCPVERRKLKTLKQEVEPEKDLTQNQIIDFISILKDELLSEANPNKITTPSFHDKHQIIPKNNLLLLSGSTEAGKTAFSLRMLENFVKEGKKIAIWEHSETNRFNRLNKWIKDKKLDKKNIVLSTSRKEILNCFQTDYVVLIDDTDSFFQIQKTTDRREVADTLDKLSYVCQLQGFTLICCHYQTKTSRSEKDAKLRSGGSMTWINKVRYAFIIERGVKSVNTVTYENEIKEQRTETEEKEASFIKLQKGHGRTIKDESWWLNADYSVGEKMSKEQYKSLIKEAVEGESDMIGQVDKLITDYMAETGTNKMPKKDYLKLCFNNLYIKKSQAYNYLLRLKSYGTEETGFGANKVTNIYKKTN